MIDFMELIGADVEFLPGVEMFNEYVESGMRATILHTAKYPELGLFKIFVSYMKFESHNEYFETARFENGKTHRQLESYSGMDEFCVSSHFNLFKIIQQVPLTIPN